MISIKVDLRGKTFELNEVLAARVEPDLLKGEKASTRSSKQKKKKRRRKSF